MKLSLLSLNKKLLNNNGSNINCDFDYVFFNSIKKKYKDSSCISRSFAQYKCQTKGVGYVVNLALFLIEKI